MLTRLIIDVESLAPVIAILDSQKIAQELLLGRGFKLKSLLEELSRPRENLHNAGNDANCTTRAMLVLALTSHTFARMQASQSIGPLLRKIAYDSIIPIDALRGVTGRSLRGQLPSSKECYALEDQYPP